MKLSSYCWSLATTCVHSSYAGTWDYRSGLKILIAADPINFDGRAQFHSFRSRVETDHNAAFQEVGRKSLIPEPLIEFIFRAETLASAPIIYWLGKRALKVLTETVDCTLRGVITEPLSQYLIGKIRGPIRTFRELKSKDHRPTTAVVHILTDFEISLGLIDNWTKTRLW